MRSACLFASLAVAATANEFKNVHDLTVRSNGESCAGATDVCVNLELRGDQFQPAWLEDTRHQTEKGLFCEPTSKICVSRYGGGHACTAHDQCIDRQCYEDPANSAAKVCWNRFSVDVGGACPDDKDDLCAKGAYCHSGVCRSYNNRDDSCILYYNVVGQVQSFKNHTCNPTHELLYCQPLGAPATNTTEFVEGKCVYIDEKDDGESCEPYVNTMGVRPKCAYNSYCVINVRAGVTDTCKELEEDGEACQMDSGCEFGHLCNKGTEGTFDNTGNYTMGVCEEVASKDIGHTVSDGAICKYPYVRNTTTSKCEAYDFSKVCTTDAECQVGQGQVGRRTNTFYCNVASGASEGVCATWLPDDCSGRYEEYVRYDFQTFQKAGYLFNTRSCTGAGCFSLRSMYKLMRLYGRGMDCCVTRNTPSEWGTYVAKNDGFWLPRQMGNSMNAAWQFVRLDKDDAAEVCSSEELSEQAIIIISVIFGFLGLVVAFVLVRECILYKPEQEAAAEGGDEGPKSTEPAL
eukprot:TRINITY_DN8523_c0_g1_i3.p1 TRINITY_DN8523_c0_g1~~TRINITY_DN8523_c0_g1_i3.p1  ORF type:complete len:517 (+),score=155.00 TRINITY_DN8523_c0_g1_i3:43-1593(+)